MSNASDEYAEWQGHIVPRTFSPGLVVLSYLVSIVGAWTTLELMNRRTSGRGLYNWYLLVGSSISMGGVSIWCMHFIGNRAIILAKGAVPLQIAYDPGFTALSFFVPIIVLLAAILAVGSNEKFSTIRLTLGGILAGLAICGMHYIGQAGISNYTCIYDAGKVVGSALIAIIASVAALSVFFLLRATWTNSWWKRALTATFLAGGVSGMHWLASVGTQYRLKRVDPSDLKDLNSSSTLIVVIVLSITACFILLGFTLLAQRRRAQNANRARQVVLASAIFDQDGRIMVTPEGLLPSQKITNTYIEKSITDVFEKAHPEFLWMFRTSRNWPAITALLPAMRNHLYHLSSLNRSRPSTRAAELPLTTDVGEPIEDYSLIFRELFCAAADDLADKLDEPIENIGVLYDEILNAGQIVRKKLNAQDSLFKDASEVELGARQLPLFGRGQLLFLVRNANRRQAEHLQATGFRFASIPNVADIIAHSLQVSTEDTRRRLVDMHEYAKESHMLQPGVHMAYFVIRATVRGNFDVLVRKDAKGQLPTMQMPSDSLEPWQLEYLSTMDGWSVSRCLNHLSVRAAVLSVSKRHQLFSAQLHDTLEALKYEINDPLFSDAQLIANPVLAPCRGFKEGSKPGLAQLITFRLIAPIYARPAGSKLEFSPLSFFKMQQHVYKNSPDHAVFARRIHREFGPILNGTARKSVTNGREDRSPVGSRLSSVRSGSGESTTELQTRMDRDLSVLIPKAYMPEGRRKHKFWERGRKVDRFKKSRSPNLKETTLDVASEKVPVEPNPFGGILVSQEVSVDVMNRAQRPSSLEGCRGQGMDDTGTDELAKKLSNTKKELASASTQKMGTSGTAGTELKDTETFIDRLFEITVQGR